MYKCEHIVFLYSYVHKQMYLYGTHVQYSSQDIYSKYCVCLT